MKVTKEGMAPLPDYSDPFSPPYSSFINHFKDTWIRGKEVLLF